MNKGARHLHCKWPRYPRESKPSIRLGYEGIHAKHAAQVSRALCFLITRKAITLDGSSSPFAGQEIIHLNILSSGVAG